MAVQNLRSMMRQSQPMSTTQTRMPSLSMSYTPARSANVSRVMNGIPTSNEQGGIISNTSSTPAPVRPSATTQMNIGTSNRPMFGDTYNKRAKKPAKKTKSKEPLCDCGKPISQCECEGHNHSASKKAKSHGKSLQKGLPLRHRNKYF